MLILWNTLLRLIFSFYRPFKNFQLNFTSLNQLVFVYLSFRFFLEGAEEFFIQPTAWYYMKYLGESNVFLGLTLAAYSTASFIFSPIFGIFQMKYQASKGIVLISGLIKFSGNLLYSIPVNGYFPLFGRFISGIGEGSLGVLFGVVSKATNSKNRAKAYIYFNGLWGIGSVFGPMIGSGLTFNVNVLGWEINAGNSPAIVVAIVWFLLLILATFLPSDLAENSQVEEIEEDEDSDENDDEHSETRGNICCNSSTVFCLYYLIFLRTFVYNAVSFYTPLLAVYHLGLGLNHVKLIYLNGALFGFFLNIASDLILDSGKISERKYIFMVSFSMIIPISITFYFTLVWNNAITVNAGYLLLISMIIATAQLVIFALTCSFLSKITPTNRAAFYQSLAFAALNLSVVTARLTSGATFDKVPMMYSCLCLLIAWAIGMIWLAFEYKVLSPKT